MAETTTRPAGVPLSSELSDPEAFPYFLWDDPMPVREVRERLRTSSHAERIRLLAKILREARDTEVWEFTSPEEVARQWTELSPHLGRRRSFWEFLLRTWRDQGRTSALHDAARAVGATTESLRTSPSRLVGQAFPE